MDVWDQPVLTTARLVLRRPDDGDLDAIVAICGDREVARRLAGVPHPYGPDDARFFLDTIVPNDLVWAITLRETAMLVGMIGLSPDHGGGAWELGYWIARDRWGQGIATEAGAAVVGYAMRDLWLASLGSGHFIDNPASGRVLEKLGFVETGRGERPCAALDAAQPSVEMRLLPR